MLFLSLFSAYFRPINRQDKDISEGFLHPKYERWCFTMIERPRLDIIGTDDIDLSLTVLPLRSLPEYQRMSQAFSFIS